MTTDGIKHALCIPLNGYTAWVTNILDNIPLELKTDFFHFRLQEICQKSVYTGKIDELFNYCYGELEYRTLRFDHQTLKGDYQGIAGVNYPDIHVPYTRITEHKHFTFQQTEDTVITKEYPEMWQKDSIPYYPINDQRMI